MAKVAPARLGRNVETSLEGCGAFLRIMPKFMEQEKPAAKRYTVAEFMALEKRGNVRHKFFEGEVFVMAGASTRYNLLVGNCFLALRTGLRGKDCRVFTESV